MRTDTEYFARCNDSLVMSQLIRSEVYSLIHSFFKNNHFVFVDPPILHEQIQKKDYEVYIPLFNNRYSLNSSNALFMAAYASKLSRVYSISASFRNEQESINHLLEFRMLEVEILNMSFNEMMVFVESLLIYIFDGLLKNSIICKNKELRKRIKTIIDKFPIAKKPYYSLLDELNRKYNLLLDDSVDLSSIDYIVSKYLQHPVFIIDYPSKIATWTAKTKDANTSYAFNLILPNSYGELCEGCERSNNVEQMKYKFKCAQITNLEWFISSINEINVSRCGFGIGIERLLRWIIGTDEISEVVLFPRIKDTEME